VATAGGRVTVDEGMRAWTSSGWSGGVLALALLAAGCGGGGAQVQLPGDGGRDGADAREGGTDEPETPADAADVALEAPGSPDAGDAPAEGADESDAGVDAPDDGTDKPADTGAEASPTDAPSEKAEAGADAKADLPKPPATA